MNDNNNLEYITFPKSFENYRWFKPLLVIAVGVIMTVLCSGIIWAAFAVIFKGNYMMSLLDGGYEALNTVLGEIITDVTIIVMIPILYIASRIVRDRPFSSYSSSRGGWNYRLYFKALIIP